MRFAQAGRIPYSAAGRQCALDARFGPDVARPRRRRGSAGTAAAASAAARKPRVGRRPTMGQIPPNFDLNRAGWEPIGAEAVICVTPLGLWCA
jgi:hypothetical protein